MKIRDLRVWLLGGASTVAIATGAMAGDAPMRAPSWSGWYAGLSLGTARHEWDYNETSTIFSAAGTFWSSSKTGFSIAGQLGHNWQSGNFVYGLEADLAWIAADRTLTIGPGGFVGANVLTSKADIDWLVTLRGRAGYTIDRTLLYVTAGLAIADVNSGWSDTGYWNGTPRTTGGSKTRTGWTAGVGVEHMFAPNWTGRLEFRYTDLGSRRVSWFDGGTTYATEFSNKLFEVRAGLNWRF